MMAQRYADAEVTGIEIDNEAAAQAKENAAASPFSGRVRIEAVSLQTFTCDTPFDAITCNPPYYDNSLNCPDESRNTARHTTSLSYAELITHSKRLLTDDGTLNLVLPTDCLKSIELECAYASMFIKDRAHKHHRAQAAQACATDNKESLTTPPYLPDCRINTRRTTK